MMNKNFPGEREKMAALPASSAGFPCWKLAGEDREILQARIGRKSYLDLTESLVYDYPGKQEQYAEQRSSKVVLEEALGFSPVHLSHLLCRSVGWDETISQYQLLFTPESESRLNGVKVTTRLVSLGGPGYLRSAGRLEYLSEKEVRTLLRLEPKYGRDHEELLTALHYSYGHYFTFADVRGQQQDYRAERKKRRELLRTHLYRIAP